MKPFNLIEAKQGKPICTRNGRKARLLGEIFSDKYPLIVAVTFSEECALSYTSEGCFYSDSNDGRILIDDMDLFMVDNDEVDNDENK